MMHNFHALFFAAATVVAGVNVTQDGAGLLVGALSPAPIEGGGVGPDRVVAGGTYLIDWSLIKRTACSGDNSRVWSGDGGFMLSEESKPTSLPSDGEWHSYQIQTEIPSLAPAGDLALSVVGWYQCPGADRQHFTLGPVIMRVEE